MIELPPAQLDKPIPRINGVFVTRVRRTYTGPKLRPLQYFSSTLRASQHMGFTWDAVGAALKRARKTTLPMTCAANVGGVSFLTAIKAYQFVREHTDLPEARAELQKLFPKFFEGGKMSGGPFGPIFDSPVCGWNRAGWSDLRWAAETVGRRRRRYAKDALRFVYYCPP
jgi:hypothetical protein